MRPKSASGKIKIQYNKIKVKMILYESALHNALENGLLNQSKCFLPAQILVYRSGENKNSAQFTVHSA